MFYFKLRQELLGILQLILVLCDEYEFLNETTLPITRPDGDFLNSWTGTGRIHKICLLALANDLRTLDWKEVFGYPEGVLKQMKELLATV